ncbi:glycosyltransferase family 4 protein [Roseivirga sp. E12]|uniref:glycosyltransferase family 4 protein n=1 Tax=Roseivirga sp. E12 TaxID=2819237 RepID=UPI001ABCB944|nr:glycosyltransferase family 4 protein [Roseivirga sp. E12]MBO3699072.1 glycosyltransferase family 4 protein [Roseivirga sp. E12]
MKPIKLLYLGNDLSHHGLAPTTIETLTRYLSTEFEIVKASHVKNQFLRILHMWLTVVKNRGFDYLIIDTYSTSAFHFAWTSARLANWFNLKYIPVLHGGELPKRLNKSPKLITKYLREAFKVVCPSDYLKTEMKKVHSGINYEVVPNPIDLSDYRFKRPSKFVFVDGRIKLLWVRSFHKIYNPMLAVRVLHELVAGGYKQAELCMVGPDKDGSQSQVEELAKELGVEDHLRITGKLTKKEWVLLANEYDVFINTTNVDNSPVSVIEAMALGLPVISTNVGGIPHILDSNKNAILVEPNNTHAFVYAIERLNDDDFVQQLSENARTTAEGYSWDRIRPQWLSILK